MVECKQTNDCYKYFKRIRLMFFFYFERVTHIKQYFIKKKRIIRLMRIEMYIQSLIPYGYGNDKLIQIIIIL